MANINSMNVGGQLSMIEDTAARDMEANAYDSTQTYAKEDICIYNDKLYEANTSIVTPEAFNIAHWTETTLGKIAQKHRDFISKLTENFQWSDKKSLGDNGCGISLSYRYNEGLKLVELLWDGSINNEITVGSAGYAWNGFPLDKSPKRNIFIPVTIGTSGVCIQFYPAAAQNANKFTLITLISNVSSGYCCGSYVYSYA